MPGDHLDPDQASISAVPDLVWWRVPALSTDVPRRHGIGWASTDGSRHGTHLIESEHLRLSRQQVETHLLAHLLAQPFDNHPDPVRAPVRATPPTTDLHLQPVHDHWNDVDPQVRLLADGHHVVRLNLAHHFGPDVLAGLAIEIRGRGIAARIALDTRLDHDQTRTSLTWAEHQLATFTNQPDHTHLRDLGWTNPTPSRWQHLQRKDPSGWIEQ